MTPVGPIRVDFGYKLDREEFEDPYAFRVDRDQILAKFAQLINAEPAETCYVPSTTAVVTPTPAATTWTRCRQAMNRASRTAAVAIPVLTRRVIAESLTGRCGRRTPCTSRETWSSPAARPRRRWTNMTGSTTGRQRKPRTITTGV